MKDRGDSMEPVAECPSYEQVSAFVDGELAEDSPDYRHIVDCPECGKRLEAYSRIGERLSKELAGAVPAGLIDGIELELERERKRAALDSGTTPFRALLKIAALVALSLSAFFILTRAPSGGSGAKPALLADSRPPARFLGDASAHPESRAVRKQNGSQFGNDVNMRDFTPVDSNGTRVPVEFGGPAAAARNAAARIHPDVAQTWCVPSASKAAALFAEYAKMGGASAIKKVDRDGNTVLSCRLKKSSLVNLVRGMRANGCDLLSPAQPQPEQEAFAGKGDDMVSYRAVLVEE